MPFNFLAFNEQTFCFSFLVTRSGVNNIVRTEKNVQADSSMGCAIIMTRKLHC